MSPRRCEVCGGDALDGRDCPGAHAPGGDPAAETRATYESMQTRELVLMQEAFAGDLMEATTAEKVAFCVGRLSLITEILNARK